jgi:hypothetical protein
MSIIEEDVSPHGDEYSEASTLPQVEQVESSVNDALKAFGLDDEEQKTEVKDAPPIEQPKTEEKKGITVKFNKEDTFIEDDKVPELARKGLNYDKVEGRAKELQDNLDRAAKLAGYKDHAEYVADFDKIEAQQKQQQKDAHNQLLTELREQAEDAGLDPDKLEAFLKSHPLVQEGERAIQERERFEQDRAEQTSKEVTQSKWNDLYTTYPQLAESSKVFNEGGSPDWFTPEMKSRIERGYDPKDAYELAHRDTLQSKSKKMTEQRVIKEQHLGLRSRVETTTDSDKEPSVPNALASAFAAFGLPVDSAKKYMTK